MADKKHHKPKPKPDRAPHVSDRGVNFVAGWEGFRSCPYWDGLGGVWTRGYGETQGITGQSRCVTEQEAKSELKRRLNRDYMPAIPRLNRMKQQEIDALASFAYNLGPGAVSDPSYSTLAKRLKSKEGKTFKGRRGIYKDELHKWDGAGGHAVAGLTKRRAAETRLARKGDYSGRP